MGGGASDLSGIIKSIQHGVTTLNLVASNTSTINEIDTSKSIILHRGTEWDGGDDSPAHTLTWVELTDSTTVTCYKGAGSNGQEKVYWTVIEFV